MYIISLFVVNLLIDSAPRLGLLSLTLSVCLLCLSRCSFKLLLLFCFWMESSHFWPSILCVALYKTFSSNFDLGPVTPKIFTCTKSPLNRPVWQIHRKCLGLLGGFRGWPIQWNHVKCCGANPCCHGNDICARRGV